MDSHHFDRLVKTLAAADTRRGLLRGLRALPLAGLLALLRGEASEAGRHHRRSAHNRRHSGRGKDQRKGKRKDHHHHHKDSHHARCHAESRAQTCAGRCGPVTNNCKKTIDCGSCVCDPPCAACFTCNAGNGACEVDATQSGQDCRDPGQVCQGDGSCACSGDSCGACRSCQGDGTCVPADLGTDCGDPGQVCQSDGSCACNATSCGSGQVCCGDVCVANNADHCGATCTTCSNPTPDCNGTTCVCQGDSCGSGQVCCGGKCQECCSSADCDLGLVCDASQHVCRSCASRNECAPIDRFGNRDCSPLFDGSGQSRCTNFGLCTCPGTCADCGAGLLCFRTGGAVCQGKNLCCPATPAL